MLFSSLTYYRYNKLSIQAIHGGYTDYHCFVFPFRANLLVCLLKIVILALLRLSD